MCLLTDEDRNVGAVVALLVYCSDSNSEGTALADLLLEQADSTKHPGML